MPGTPKTTKAVREAPTAPEENFKAWTQTPEGQKAIIDELERRGVTPQAILDAIERKTSNA